MRLHGAVALVIGAPLILLGLLGPASGAILAESTFDSDADGWTAIGFDFFTVLSLPVAFASGDGNPDGALRHEDDALSARSAFFVAPAKFIAALHLATGGSIQWDVATLPALGHTFFSITDIGVATGPSLVFSDAVIFTEVTPPAPPDAPTYAEYELSFLVADGWRFADGPFRGGAPLATQAEIDAVLADATFLLIRAEYHESLTGTPGPDVVFLDKRQSAGRGDDARSRANHPAFAGIRPCRCWRHGVA